MPFYTWDLETEDFGIHGKAVSPGAQKLYSDFWMCGEVGAPNLHMSIVFKGQLYIKYNLKNSDIILTVTLKKSACGSISVSHFGNYF